MAKETKEEQKALSIADIAKKLNRKFKNNSLILAGDTVPSYEKLESKALGISYPLYGGLPLGRINQVTGLSHTGKTSIAARVMADYLDKFKDKVCLYVDLETTFDLKYHAAANGFDPSRVYYMQPTGAYAEEVFNMILELQKADNIGLIVLDSIPALIPGAITKDDLDMTIDHGMQANVAKSLGNFLKIMNSAVAESNTMLLLINQTRTKLSPSGAIIYSEPGGYGPQFFSSVILRCGPRTFTLGQDMDACKKKNGEGADGYRLSFKVVKNKTAPVARGGGYLTYRYATGLDWQNDLLTAAFDGGFIEALNQKTHRVLDFSQIDPKTGQPEVMQKINDDGTFGGPLQGTRKDILDYFSTHPEIRDDYCNHLRDYITYNDMPQAISLLDAELSTSIDAEESAVGIEE